MSSDTTSLSSANITLVFPVNRNTEIIKYFQKQDEVIYTNDTILSDTNIIFQNRIIKPDVYCQSLTNVSSIKRHEINLKSTFFYNTDWIIYFLLFCFILYAYLQNTFLKKQRIIFNSFFNYRYTNQLIREGNIYNESGFYLLLFLSLMSCVFLLLSWGIYYFYGNFLFVNSLLLFIKILTLFLILYFGKIIILLFIAHVFKLRKLYSEFVLTQHVFFISFGLIALFFSVLIFFTTTHFIILSSIFIFLSFFTNYIIRLYILTIGSGFFSLFYFFLYICTIEIMPLLVVYKMLNKI